MKKRNEITADDIYKTIKASREALIKARQMLAVDYMVPEISQKFDGGMTCIIGSMHKDMHRYRGVVRKQVNGVDMNPRGMGSDSGLCLICGKSGLFGNFASFVKNKEEGEQIVEMFAKRGMPVTLDYRDYEPNWVQIKIQACRDHQDVLEPLMMAIVEYGFISPEMINNIEVNTNVG
jgi:hypothetical protein